VKLSGRDAQAFFRKPDATGAGVLIHGADASRVSVHGKEVAEKLLGPAGADEMRLTRLSAGEIRRDPAALQDALKAQGFFPGQQVVLVEDGGDGIAKAAGAALDDWQQGDGFLIVLAGALPPRSSLRKLFEGAANARTAPVYDEPPGRADIEAALKTAGIGRIEPAALEADAPPGTVLSIDREGVAVACGRGAVRLTTVTPPGKPSMPAADWAHGARLKVGDRLA